MTGRGDQFAVMLDVRAAQQRVGNEAAAMAALAEELCRRVNHLVSAAQTALSVLDDLTTEAFQQGGDRPARAALVVALERCGLATPEQEREYRNELVGR